ncbi:MAG TPA: alpha-2-macroglobulin family protein, partial [Kofleriaceae bacterium]|nr:alpha-2-macroglobulin family protein [Kofleriaceae bacterium]
MKRAVVIAMLLGTRGASHADALGTLEGSVVNETGKVVTSGLSLTITCGSVRRSASVDGAGHFSVGGLPAGACTVTSAGGAFGPVSLSVEVTADSIATILVTAVSRAYLDEVRKQNEQRARHPMPPMATPVEPTPMGVPVPEPMPRRVHAARPAVKQAPPPPPVIPDKPVAMRQGQIRLVEVKAKNIEQPRVVDGWAVARVFPVPHYAKPYDGPRSDFRETIYWNANVETNASGDADVSFVTSDAVTSFHATVEGFSAKGTPGAGELDVKSRLPMSIDAHLPVEVTSGDVIRLPITVSNDTEIAIVASLDASFGAAFKLADNPV